MNLIAQQELLPENTILRGGKLDNLSSPEEIGNPQTIINLRRGAEKAFSGIVTYHFPISNAYEKYDTNNKEVRTWLNNIIKVFENEQVVYPVFIHCTSGKDRTGVVIAALLWTLQIPEHVIIEEYLLSEGEVRRDWIIQTLNGIKNHQNYFERRDVERIRHNILLR